MGDTIWTRKIGGREDDNGWCVKETPDKGFIIAGFTKSYQSVGEDVLLLKTDANGREQWHKTFGGPGDDWLFGAVDPNVLNGGPGDFDVMWGGPNMDYLDGGAGTHDVCMMQRDLGDYNPSGCNTAIRAKDVCLPASVDAPALAEPEKHEDE